MRAWVFQDSRQRQQLGTRCAWSVGWIDSRGKRRSKVVGTSKTLAKKFAEKKKAEHAKGLVEVERKKWSDFRAEYEKTVTVKWRSGDSRLVCDRSLNLFEQLVKPVYLDQVDDKAMDEYVAKRLTMPGKKRGDLVSAETIRKEVRTVRAALTFAVRWNYLEKVPYRPEIEGYGREKPYVTEGDFVAMLEHVHAARLPANQYYDRSDFWRALIVTAWTTGLRKSALLGLLWEDLDFSDGTVLLRARSKGNKRKRDQRPQLGPAMPLLKKLYSLRVPSERRVFPWDHAVRTLTVELERIQKSAGIWLPCKEEHEHNDSCHAYGWHSFRYAHATFNAGRVTDRELQEQMGHASFSTTERYVKYAKERQRKTYDVYMPTAANVG